MQKHRVRQDVHRHFAEAFVTVPKSIHHPELETCSEGCGEAEPPRCDIVTLEHLLSALPVRRRGHIFRKYSSRQSSFYRFFRESVV